MSHEIRTPLNTVKIGIDLLKKALLSKSKDIDTDAMMDIVYDVEGQCEVAVEILNDLLHIEKIEGGTFALEISVISAWSLISNTMKPFQLQVSK